MTTGDENFTMSNKILIILIGVMMVFMLGLGGGLFMMWNKLSAMETQNQASAEGGDEADEEIGRASVGKECS